MARATPKECNAQMLFVALELSKLTWLVAATDRNGVEVRFGRVDAGRIDQLERFLAKVKKRLGLEATGPMSTCYEAGRDGFWLHRALVARGIENVVLDPSSIEVPRRMRHAKTDRLDAGRLLQLLLRLERGERAARVVRVPSPEQEDLRQTHRERERLMSTMTSKTNQIEGLLAAQGVQARGRSVTKNNLDKMRGWDGSPLPRQLHQRLVRAVEAVDLIRKQIAAVDKELRVDFAKHLRKEKQSAGDNVVAVDNAVMLNRLVGVGWYGATVLCRELFNWRDFQNRRQLGGCTGLVSVPRLSGAGGHQQGISRAGRSEVRKLLVEQAWSWLRYQPDSALTKWFHERFGRGKRNRRVGIVAVARKLVVAMWRYLKLGVVPEGAILRGT